MFLACPDEAIDYAVSYFWEDDIVRFEDRYGRACMTVSEKS